MMVVFYLLICLYLLIQLIQLFGLFRYQVYQNADLLNLFFGKQTEKLNLPQISILIACRNEEDNIINCLNSIHQLNYPKDKIQIIVGNDQSTDRTKVLVEGFIHDFGRNEHHNYIKLINIVDDSSNLKAKARVMAQLDVHATGEFYLITDADVCVNPNWAIGLLGSLSNEMGVASGTTMVKSAGIGGMLQEIDWTYFMGLLNLISFSGIPATAVGNNMIVRKTAYWETGGYSKIQFSITEDYKLYAEICKKGWKWNNVLNPHVLAFTEKINGFIPLLHQRKRWLSGGKELPWYWWILFGIYALFYFVIPVTIFLNWKLGLGLWLAKFILQTIQINRIYRLLNQPNPSLLNHFMYEIYMYFVTIGTAIFFILPTKTIWKERKY